MKICIVSSLSEADELMLEMLEERRMLAVCGVGVSAMSVAVAVVDVDRHGEITEITAVREREVDGEGKSVACRSSRQYMWGTQLDCVTNEG